MTTDAAARRGSRNLWGDAWLRLSSNRAAITSMIVLAAMVLFSIFGPWLSPHAFNTVYRSYIKVPPSLTAYPQPQDIQEIMTRTLRRARVDIQTIDVNGDRLSLGIASEQEISLRVRDILERVDDFSDVTITSGSSDSRQMSLEMTITRQLFLFGTDSNGRDILTRVMIGGRVSLAVGILATLVALLIGVSYGAISGFIGGRVDHVMMRIVDMIYALPFMFFVILLVVFFGRDFFLIFIAIGAVEWLDMARIVRGQTLVLKRREFIEAARALGVSTSRIISRHVVPNTLGPVIIYMTLMVPKVILLESFLSFIGLGVQEPMTSWGVLISDGADNIAGAIWMLVFPSVFLAITLFCLNFIGDGLRDALDPKDR
ncbi:MAG: ABC transporter permease subunit [Pseudomonadota bacterium]